MGKPTGAQQSAKGLLRGAVEVFWRRGWTVEDMARAASVDVCIVRKMILQGINAGRLEGPPPEKRQARSEVRRKSEPRHDPKPISAADRRRRQLQQLPKRVRIRMAKGPALFPAGQSFKAPKAQQLSLIDVAGGCDSQYVLPIDLERGKHG